MSAVLDTTEGQPGWQMKKLLPWHKQMCSMLAQGIDRQTISQVFQKTPEYISMLAGQQLVREEVAEMKRFAEFQLEAQFVKSVSVIGEVLETGSAKEKIQAARLQLEATRRIGPRMVEEEKLVDTNARLARLAERLLYLQGGSLPPAAEKPITVEVIEHEQEGRKEAGKGWPDQSAQANGNGGEGDGSFPEEGEEG